MSSIRYLLLAACIAAAGAVAMPACGSDEPAEKPPEGPDTGGENCANDVDDDADGLIDCADDNCAVLEECQGVEGDCVAQGDCHATGDVTPICSSGKCEPAAELNPDGTDVVRGTMMVFNNLDSAMIALQERLKAYAVESYHTVRPDGTSLDCDTLIAMVQQRAVTNVNRLARSVGRIDQAGETIPAQANDIPVGSSGSIMLSLFYSTHDNGEPGGELVALGCTEDVVVIEGDYDPEGEDVEQRAINVDIGAPCDPNDTATCPDGLTCKPTKLLCVDERCGVECTSSSLAVCREVEGEPTCLKRCDPDPAMGLSCKSGERCDTTPGQTPACIPVQ